MSAKPANDPLVLLLATFVGINGTPRPLYVPSVHFAVPITGTPVTDVAAHERGLCAKRPLNAALVMTTDR